MIFFALGSTNGIGLFGLFSVFLIIIFQEGWHNRKYFIICLESMSNSINIW